MTAFTKGQGLHFSCGAERGVWGIVFLFGNPGDLRAGHMC